MRSAVSPNDARFAVLVQALDRDGASMAATWRDVARAAEQLGLRRPSYAHVRRLVLVERRRRDARRRARALVGDTASAFASGRVPDLTGVLVKLNELRAREELVLQEHKAFGAAAPRRAPQRSRSAE